MVTSPYFPDIMEGVVARASTSFLSRTVDPFAVFFDKGLYSQVSRNIYAQGGNTFPLVWLVFNFSADRGKDFSIWGEVTARLIIAMPTDNSYTQQQRDDLSYKPRLLPIYDMLMQEIARERMFQFQGGGRIEHKMTLRPYWGGGDVNGVDTDNLFKKKIDAIDISGLKLRGRSDNCLPSQYSLLQPPNYPAIDQILLFEDDIELLVDGGRGTDPVDGQNSVIIPALLGRQFTVAQRSFGQLRKERTIEVTPDTVNGGFALGQGYVFKANDTYIVQIRPRVVSDVTGLTGTLSNNVNKVFVGSNS